MELLPTFGVNSEPSREEFVRKLRCENSAEQVRCLRQLLFEDALRKNLADVGDVLVTRKKLNAGKSVAEKHAEDVWSLCCAIRRGESVPRILLKNGKRGKEEWVKSQSGQRQKKSGTDCYELVEVTQSVGARCQMQVEDVNGMVSSNSGCDVQVKVADAGVARLEIDQCGAASSRKLAGSSCDNVSGCRDRSVFESTVVESINSLQHEVRELRSEVRGLKTTGAVLSQSLSKFKLCCLYVRVQGECGGVDNLGKSKLESLVGCQISQYIHLGNTPFPSYKVKISECDFESAVKVGMSSGCFVAR